MSRAVAATQSVIRRYFSGDLLKERVEYNQFKPYEYETIPNKVLQASNPLLHATNHCWHCPGPNVRGTGRKRRADPPHR
jgi:hypothetical protein